MKLGLKNINKIKEAYIELNALTVVTGVNDSGKSTVGKMLFSVIKSIRNMEKHYGEQQKGRIDRKTIKLYQQLQLTRFSEIWEALNVPQRLSELKQVIEKEAAQDKEWFDERIVKVDNLGVSPRYVKALKSAFQSLQEELFEDKSPLKVVKKELTETFESEFLNNLCSCGTESSWIEYSENGERPHLRVGLKDNRITDIEVTDLNEVQMNDATMVESPLYMHLMDSLVAGSTLMEADASRRLYRGPVVNYHVKDMAMKLDAFRWVPSSTLFKDERTDAVKEVIGGGFIFDEEQKKIYLQKNGQRFVPVNVASGIKTFGVLQMLLDVDAINENCILIWDEPENHLHPEWQIQFAKLLVKLAKDGITILVSSHSPYFIQAVRYYTDQMKMNKFVNYYLAEEDRDGLSRIEDMTDDLNTIFAKLARPMNEIINIGM